MLTAPINQKEQRTLIAKMRKVAEVKPGYNLEHLRTRKTTKLAENNAYILWTADGTGAVILRTNAGRVLWQPNISEVLV
jgi:hypothetical protein